MMSFPVENDNESKIGSKDLGLKNLMQQSHLHYLFSVRLRNYRTQIGQSKVDLYQIRDASRDVESD